jgi:hypothetical protein
MKKVKESTNNADTNFQTFSIVKLGDKIKDFCNNLNPCEEYETTEEVAVSKGNNLVQNQIIAQKPHTTITNFDAEFNNLMDRLSKRHVIEASGAAIYQISNLVGRVVCYNADTKKYEIAFLPRFYDTDSEPTVKIIEPSEGILYSNKIYDEKNINLFNSLFKINAASTQLIESLIRDEMCCFIDGNHVLRTEIKDLKNKIETSELSNYFLVLSVLSTVIEHRIFKETQFNASVSATYITAGGKIYSSKDNFIRQRQLSIEILPLKNIF